MTGEIINGTYRLVREIGAGGMGSIWEAEHVRVGRRFALKFLKKEVADNPEVFARFRREAEIAGRLGHPHIIEVVDFNSTDDGTSFMVMECLEGEDLAARLHTRGPFALEPALRIIGDAVDALSAAHAAGVVHRDLKPQNIFLSVRGRERDVVKLLDFGISKIKSSAANLTKTDAVMGTPYYMSPEQAQGRTAEIDARTDIFAMGAIVYEMLTGHIAFEAPSAPTAMFRVCYEDPTPLSELRSDLPGGVEGVLAKAMHKDRDERYADILVFWEDLRRVASGQAAVLRTGQVHRVAVPGGEVEVQGAEGAEDATAPALLPTEVAGADAGAAADDPRSAPAPAALAADTTMSGAAGEEAAAIALPTRRARRGALYAVGGLVGVLVIASALYFGLRDRRRAEVSGGGRGGAASTSDAGDSAVAPSPGVTLSLNVRPVDASVEIWVGGQRIRGRRFTRPRSDDTTVDVKVAAPGYRTVSLQVLPNRDKRIPVTLDRSEPGSRDAMSGSMSTARVGPRRPMRAPPRRRRTRPVPMKPPPVVSMRPRVTTMGTRPTMGPPPAKRPATRPAMTPPTMTRPTMKGPVWTVP